MQLHFRHFKVNPLSGFAHSGSSLLAKKNVCQNVDSVFYICCQLVESDTKTSTQWSDKTVAFLCT
jgi:hypothetical protein